MRLLGRLAFALVMLGIIGAAGGWALTAPRMLSEVELAALTPGDAAKGERIFYAGGCASCHAAPGASGDDRLNLAGGVRLKTDFGTFVAPNISPDPEDGIGRWTAGDLANAMLKGVSPDGQHYYPAFPFTSYARMTPSDVADLHAFLKTLPPVSGKAAAHEVSFPFNIRRGLGLWKLLYLDPRPVVAEAEVAGGEIARGRYLVEGPSHCGECHTPRNALGGPRKDAWLSGATAAEGSGIVPNITGGEGGIGDWTAADIAELLQSGFTPDFDSVGGAMADVVKNTAQLSAEDRAAMAAYLKSVPPHPNGYPAPESANP